jgi:hypothetical protein
MTQLSASQARVVDPILTTVAQGYQNNEMVGSILFPRVNVAQRAGKIIQFGKESFQDYDSARAPGTNIKRINVGYSSSNYGIVDYALDAVVPTELMQEAAAVPSISLSSASVRTVQDSLALRLEVEQAALATTAGNYGAGNKTTLSGTSQWSDLTNSNPISDIENAKDAIRASTGKMPNVLVISHPVLKALRQHSKVIDRTKYTGRDVPTLELLAALFGVDKVVVGSAIKATDAGVFSDVWGKSAVLAYTNMSGISDAGRPTYGYTYTLGGYPFVKPARKDENIDSWIYGVADAVQPVIASATSGFLISAAVA